MHHFRENPKQKRVIGFGSEKSVPKEGICFGSKDPKPKMWLDISKPPLAFTSLASGGHEPRPNRTICLGY